MKMNEENLRLNCEAAQTPAQATERLLRILQLLRQLCPWDKKQSFESLRYLTLEEVYELSDALLDKRFEEVKKELGDVFLHLFFYSELGREAGLFDYVEVLNSLCDKLIRRHPHIFAEVEANSAEDVKQNWEAIKLKEGSKHSLLSGVPTSLPAMVKAYRIQEKARGVGFDWENTEQVWDKVLEELAELREEIEKQKRGEKSRISDEFGDLLFALINYSRFIDVNPDDALEHTNRKFISRFKHLEESTIMKGLSLHNMSLDEMNVYWEEAKAIERLQDESEGSQDYVAQGLATQD